MGYACPVCGTEEADDVHLANHLAVTASVGRTDHEEWLAEHAPDWAARSPEELGAIVREHAPEIDTAEFETTAAHEHDHGRPDSLESGLARQGRGHGRGSLTAEAEQVLQEARELTERMVDADEADAGDENENA